MKYIKRILLILVLGIVCNIAHGAIFSANTVEGVSMKFQINEGQKTCKVAYKAVSETTQGTITIPSIVNGYSVTGIGSMAFSNCQNLTNIIIPNSIIFIDTYAFDFCTGLTNIIIPSSVQVISSSAFYYCSNQNSIQVDSKNEKYDSRNNCNAIIETISNTLIKGCKNTLIPNSVCSIGDYAFSQCIGLTDVSIPKSVSSIGQAAFAACTGLESITIPSSISSIGNSAFYGCTGIKVIISMIKEPFPINENVFQYKKDGVTQPLNAMLYVPYGTKSNYQATAGWNKFTNIVEMDPQNGDTFKADISNGTATVSTTFMLTDSENRHVSIGDGTNTAIATATTGNITIPETIVGPGNLTYTVNSISSKAFASSKISSVSIPQRIISIGDNAFNGCSNLTSVTVEWPEPLAINSTCFSNASNATLNVPKGCYETYAGAENWSSFKTIVEPAHTIGDSFAASITAGSGTTDAVFKVIDAAKKYVGFGNGEEPAIADYTSGKVVILSTVTGYDGQTYQVKQISDAAFFDCYEVTAIELPDGITSIGRVAFYDCAGLSSFTIPATVTSIDEEAFNNCYNLTSINIPASVTSLGVAAFVGCSKLTSVTVNWNEPIAIDDECFTNAANATLNIPKGTYMNYATADNWKNFITIKEPAHSVGDSFMASITAGGTKVNAIFKVTNTTNKYVSIGDGEDSAIDIFTSGNIVIPSTVKGYDGQTYTVKTVADAAFFGCENMSSVSLPSSITEIGNSAFLRCYNLANITIPTTVTKIGNEAFFYCEKLSSISIPKNVTSIGTKAFKNCNMLTSVTAGWNTPIAIDSECFSNAANATLNVPYGAKERYEAATGWKQFKNIVEMAPKDGDMFTALTAEGIKMTFTIISASAKTCKVGDGSNSSISTGTNGAVTIPSSANGFAVTQIAYKAFYNCSQITGTVIPTSVTSIGSYAFSGCNNLTSVTVGWDEPISIGTTCFSNAANATLYVPIGTNYDYSIATGWKNFGQIANWTNSSLAADDVIVCRGGQLTLPITLSNEEAIRSLQFELSLPEGVSVVTDGKGNPIASLTQRANTTHIITGTPLSNGNFQFQIMPKAISDDVIQGNEGRIATITLKVLMNTAPNDYEIRITDSELDIDGEIMPLLLPDTESKLTVSSVLLGDTNDDKRVSVTDISNVIDYILHKDIPGFVWHAANVSGDEKISVTDISTIIDIILHKTVFGEKQATRKEEIDQQ